MSIGQVLILLLVAGICGCIAQAIVGYSKRGCMVSIALGFIGALLGSWLSDVLELPEIFNLTFQGQNFPVVWSIIGAALFLAILSILQGGRERK